MFESFGSEKSDKMFRNSFAAKRGYKLINFKEINNRETSHICEYFASVQCNNFKSSIMCQSVY